MHSNIENHCELILCIRNKLKKNKEIKFNFHAAMFEYNTFFAYYISTVCVCVAESFKWLF